MPNTASSAPPALVLGNPYHAPVIPFRAALLLAVLLGTGCLDNLNQQKYFDKLGAAAPSLAARVVQHREAIERQLVERLRADAPSGVTHIGLWGESWDLVRRVTDGEQIFMRGRVFYEQGPASTYYLAFRMAEGGTVIIDRSEVYVRRQVPQ